MPFEIVRNDITKMSVDAIVNTANPEATIGCGVDAAIHEKAGAMLLQARKEIGEIDVGQAAITPGFGLDAKYVIHVVCPAWTKDSDDAEELLAMCYRNALELAKTHGCESVAFPLISAGTLGFPKPVALQIAVREFSAFLMENDMWIYLVVFSKDAFVLSGRLFNGINSYIDEDYVWEKTAGEYGITASSDAREAELMQVRRTIERRERTHRRLTKSYSSDPAAPTEKNLSVLDSIDAGFSDTLMQLITHAGKKDSQVYRKANIDRRLFSKIRSNKNYKPSKITALALAIALELDIDQTREFIARAGYALSRSSQFDSIVESFIRSGNYDIFLLNEVLFDNDLSLIRG